MSLALYRKYRPKTFSDLVGQEAIVAVLTNAAKQDKIAHAYLFYGSRGTGKTTTARLLAKLLNCEKRASDAKFKKQGEPCNACRVCTEIDNGTLFDLIEIDAASNRGIDEIRNLKEGIAVAPTGSAHKVYIIDEAHMLTRDAMNALLKTLEEPPAHAVIILATTEYDKLPPTITSRTQRFIFKKLPKTKILEKLERIVKAESITVDAAALELIAAAADGSLRDAESLLDQARSIEGTISVDAVERMTGRLGSRRIGELAQAILQRDAKQSLNIVTALQSEGHNIIQATKDLIHYLRRVLALHVDPSLESIMALDLTTDELAAIKALSPTVDQKFLIPFLRALIRGYAEMPYSPFALISLELVLEEHLK